MKLTNEQLSNGEKVSYSFTFRDTSGIVYARVSVPLVCYICDDGLPRMFTCEGHRFPTFSYLVKQVELLASVFSISEHSLSVEVD